MKSTVDEIRARFDADVERFSQLETGQSAAVDSPLCLQLVAEAAAAVTPHARRILDVGCGAGNYSLTLLQRLSGCDVTLLDLSQPMLTRASQRVRAATSGRVTTLQGDVRDVELSPGGFDVIVAAAVLHHLRSPEEYRAVAERLFAVANPGASLWIVDLITQRHPAVQQAQWTRYGDYLSSLKDAAYRDAVFAYIDKEDTPWPLVDQLRWLEDAGWTSVDVLHKHLCFAAFGGIRAA